MREQLQKQVARLRELRIKKVEEPGNAPTSHNVHIFIGAEEFYGTEDLAMHNVDVMTDASAFTAFTRYTVAPTSSAPSRATTKRTSRSKRKMERKVGSGRKGTVDEEEYLLKSLTKLAGKLSEAQGTCLHAVPFSNIRYDSNGSRRGRGARSSLTTAHSRTPDRCSRAAERGGRLLA